MTGPGVVFGPADQVVAEDLELDFSDAELKKAQLPILPDADRGPEETHPLTEAPWPSGASLDSGAGLEPLLALADDEPAEEADEAGEAARGGQPSFFPRLALGAGSQGLAKVELVSELAWSLSGGVGWPVFVQRLHPPASPSAAWLKRVALAARRHGENRLCLGPHGELDVFFNDRGSMERFQRELRADLGEAAFGRSGGPVRILACRGLFSCPWAAVDSLSAAGQLSEILSGHRWSEAGLRKRPPLTLSVRGCQAGPGLGCGVPEYADILLTGRRRAYPAIDQEIASLSPRLSRLIIGCPGRALRRSHLPKAFIELDRGACLRCGWCVSQDPAFAWPDPQGGYLSLELSGRRQAPPWEHVAPRTLRPEAGADFLEIGAGLLELIELWRREAADFEILADFAERSGLIQPEEDRGPSGGAEAPSN
jgi:dissimilatory sulfite reductase (desulfoviridin) alpha/beta subunit